MTSPTFRVLLVGASGVFGARLAERLARDAELSLILAARRPAPLLALRARLQPAAVATLETATLDRRSADVAGAVAALRPWAVVDVSGPFQAADYSLPHAALACGAHYVDLADGRAFVAGFPAALDAAARAGGRAAVTGASSSPALSHAAMDALTAGWSRIDAVTVAISPGARAPGGEAVIRAILSWLGRPVRVWQGGRWTTRPGWSGTRTPWIPALGRRCLSLAETADLDLLVDRYHPAVSARFEAGLEISVLHDALRALAFVRRLGLPPPPAAWLERLARPFDRLGSDEGGLLAEAEGLDAEGRAAVARFVLAARANDGPSVPTLPAAALIRRLKRAPWVGAGTAAGLLTLDEILAEAGGLSVTTRIDRAAPDRAGVFPAALGHTFDTLPASLRDVHGAPGRFEGRAVSKGSGGAAVLVRRLLGLPTKGRGPVTVAIEREGDTERWTRRFVGGGIVSRLTPSGPFGFEETVGPAAFRFEPKRTGAGFRWRLTGARCGPLALPKVLQPRVRASAYDLGDGYRFRVVVAHSWLGVLFAYGGRLRRAP